MENYKELSRKPEINEWIELILKNYLSNPLNHENQGEIEHIIDYFNSDAAPVRLQRMSYPEAKAAAEKWVKALAKKGKNLVEVEGVDYKVIFELKDGLKFVELLTELSYTREGHLMAHCVKSYFNTSKSKVYSLRDSNNNPHATFEIPPDSTTLSQCKGKGNGSIHPKYINYIFEIAKKLRLEISSREMTYLGYFSLDDMDVSPAQRDWFIKNFPNVPKIEYHNKIYYFKGGL